MAYYRRRRSFRRRFGRGGWGYRRRRTYRRGSATTRRHWTRALASKPTRITTFTRNTTPIPVDVYGGNITSYGFYYFSMDQLPNPTEFQNLYDAYKIVKVTSYFGFDRLQVSTMTSLEQSLPTNFNNPIFAVVKDYNDSTALTSMAQAMEYENVRMCKLGAQATSRVWDLAVTTYPKMSTNVSGVSTVANMATTGWVDSATLNAKHYGLKTVCQSTGEAADNGDLLGHLRVWHKYTIQCKNVK